MYFKVRDSRKVKDLTFAFEIPFVNRAVRFNWQFYKPPHCETYGISSRCKDGRHVLFFDYDNMKETEIVDEVHFLQEHFGLSNAYMFKNDRDGSFHVIILDKFSLKKAYSILSEANLEIAYLDNTRYTRANEWVLRVAEKGKRNAPVFHRLIESSFDCWPVSTAHKRFIEMWYFVPKIKYKLEDNILEIPIINYTTGSKVD